MAVPEGQVKATIHLPREAWRTFRMLCYARGTTASAELALAMLATIERWQHEEKPLPPSQRKRTT